MPRSAEHSLKEHVSPWPHAIGFVLAAVGVGYLVIRFHRDAADLAVMCVYGGGLLSAFGASALYHWLGNWGPRRTAVLRRIDHAAIFALMAGTYTPVLYFGLAGSWRIAAMLCVWSLAIAGIISTIWFIGAPRLVSTALYLALGWAAVIPAGKLTASLPATAIELILLGGVLYTAGAAIYATRTFNLVPGRFGFHEVFHVFVVAGAAAHFTAIAFDLVPT